MKHSRVKSILLISVALSYWVAPGVRAASDDTPPPILSKLQQDIASTLSQLDKEMAYATATITKTGLTGPQTKITLNQLCAANHAIIDCITINSLGKIVTVEPATYEKTIGTDISIQEHVLRLRRTCKPVMSDLFRAVEGMEAVSIEHPILTGNGKLAGAVSVIYNPSAMLSELINPVIKGLPVDVWVIQTNGLILFDPDPEEVGRNLMTDPIYKPFTQFLDCVKTIAGQSSGSATFTFSLPGEKNPCRFEAFWSSVGLYGSEWRLVATRQPNQSANPTRRTPLQLGLTTEIALRSFVRSTELISAMASENNNAIMAQLRRFYETHPDLYSVQWIDTKGLNRFGYPEAYSLMNYDCSAPTALNCGKIMAAVRGRKATAFDDTLVEGGEAHFVLAPVFMSNRYFGLVYFIRLEPE